MTKLVAFDLDGTLAESKSALTAAMADSFAELLSKYEVAVTSGGKFSQFKTQLIDKLRASDQELSHLHILTTNAADYFHYDVKTKDWLMEFSAAISLPERLHIIEEVEAVAKQLGYWEVEHWGPIIEDRESQITFSALGQNIVAELGDEGLQRKQAWDPDGGKKKRLREELAEVLPNYRVAIGGATSIDITQPDVNKASGLAKLAKKLGIAKGDVLYIGDALQPGGNDAVVKEAGYATLPTTGPTQTAAIIKKLLTA